MSNEQHPTKGSLVPTGNRGLTTRSGALVRRGLDALRNTPEQLHRGAGNEPDKQGQCAEAEQLEKQALLPLLQGDYIQAEPLLKSALGIWEKVLGPYSWRVANNLDSLAYLYSAQGKYAEAVAHSKPALSIREKIWGPDDPDVAQGLSSLGRLYELEGKYTEAEPFFRRSLSIMEKALGKDHPFVTPDLRILKNLSWRELGIVEPPDSPHVPLTCRRMSLALSMAMSLRGLATVYGTQGKYTEAETLFKRAVAIMEKAHLGAPIVTFLEDYAALLQKMGRYVEAVELQRRAAKLESHDKAMRTKYTRENVGK